MNLPWLIARSGEVVDIPLMKFWMTRPKPLLFCSSTATLFFMVVGVLVAPSLQISRMFVFVCVCGMM